MLYHLEDLDLDPEPRADAAECNARYGMGVEMTPDEYQAAFDDFEAEYGPLAGLN